MSNRLLIKTRHGIVEFYLFHNIYCCGVVDYGHPEWSVAIQRATKRSKIRMEAYEDVLMTLRHCFADGSIVSNGWSRYSRGIGTLSDAVGGEEGTGDPTDPPSIYDMMTLVAPKLKRKGLLRYSKSLKAYNPNSNHTICTWQLVRDVHKYDNTGKKLVGE